MRHFPDGQVLEGLLLLLLLLLPLLLADAADDQSGNDSNEEENRTHDDRDEWKFSEERVAEMKNDDFNGQQHYKVQGQVKCRNLISLLITDKTFLNSLDGLEGEHLRSS